MPKYEDLAAQGIYSDAASGMATTFVCSQHAWTYDLCGRFGTLPISRCSAGVRRDESALAALPCEVRHGFVWVVPSPYAVDVPYSKP